MPGLEVTRLMKIKEKQGKDLFIKRRWQLNGWKMLHITEEKFRLITNKISNHAHVLYFIMTACH